MFLCTGRVEGIMTSLWFHGGVETVGGNCIIVEEGSHAIMLDCGMNFTDDGSFYKDFLKPRETNDMRDLLALGLVPRIPGVYARDMITDPAIQKVDVKARYMHTASLESYEEFVDRTGSPRIDALFLTHAHVDHARNLAFLAPQIPVYLSGLTRILLKVMGEVTSGNDLAKFCTYQLGSYGGMSYFPGGTKKEKVCKDRDLRVVDPGQVITIGPFSVTGHPVDHSIPGAMAYEVLTTSGKRIVYTGDLRFHGVEHEKITSRAFVDTIAERDKVDALITEGTRIDSMQGSSEQDVVNKALAAITGTPGAADRPIFAMFPWKSVARFLSLYKVARALNRAVAIQPKLAYLLHAVQGTPIVLGTNVLRNENIRIYQPRKLSMLYEDGDYIFLKAAISTDVNWNKETQDYKFYRDLYGRDKLVRASEIHEHPERFITQLDFYDLNELIDIDAPPGGTCFLMKTEPFDDDGNIERKVLDNWMTRFGLRLVEAHSSGHASGTDLVAMIERIKPKLLIPIHTEASESFGGKISPGIPVLERLERDKPVVI
ncbi:MAG: MBL fold metallo-hydrolase [Candidatus Lokiarchaeota archaeon]|nr:MBL fold metallo-hydrolase [Candidatus Lokiarchaeota archaeon]